ncbi:MAG: recombinase RmuC [Coxiella sp. DG_40]|nr:MAG: recombinase RmuC [Coxiella sp. DG_40]
MYLSYLLLVIITVILGITLLIFLLLRSLKLIQDSIINVLANNADTLNRRVDKLTEDTDKHLKEISGQVEKRLFEGFEKTTTIFTDVVKRLALIDQAQKKITELSSNVVDLQTILADKRSRGAFGEVQLSALIRNIMPEQHFSFQHTLSNGKRADCMLLLPEPTGNVVIDAKFPLESYRRLADTKLTETERHLAEQQFRTDVRKHLQDIASKYIIFGETSDGAMMFIPAEAVFAEIHAHYPDLVENSHKLRVWMVSPTTMMAVLTTARAVLKDAATRKQIHIIQEHLNYLSQDFDRFQKRMDDLARHIDQAHIDVQQVHKSSKKISSRFNKIEAVELPRGKDINFLKDKAE